MLAHIVMMSLSMILLSLAMGLLLGSVQTSKDLRFCSMARSVWQRDSMIILLR